MKIKTISLKHLSCSDSRRNTLYTLKAEQKIE